MNAKATVDSRAVKAEKDPVRHRRPRRVLRIAIEANLVLGPGFELLEDSVLVGSHRRRERSLERERDGGEGFGKKKEI